MFAWNSFSGLCTGGSYCYCRYVDNFDVCWLTEQCSRKMFFNTLRQRQSGSHFANDMFKLFFYLRKIYLTSNNLSDKLWFDQRPPSLLTWIFVTRPRFSSLASKRQLTITLTSGKSRIITSLCHVLTVDPTKSSNSITLQCRFVFAADLGHPRGIWLPTRKYVQFSAVRRVASLGGSSEWWVKGCEPVPLLGRDTWQW